MMPWGVIANYITAWVNGFVPMRHQAIFWSNDDDALNKHWLTNPSAIQTKISFHVYVLKIIAKEI